MSEEKNAPPAASFQQFLYGMFTQTLMQLGVLSNPFTGETKADLTQARYSIDLLLIFKEKTLGNLTEEEKDYMEKIISELQMGYVDAVERAETEGDTSSGSEEQPEQQPEQQPSADTDDEAGESEEGKGGA